MSLGYEVNTVGLATIPFPELLGAEHIGKLPEFTSQIADIAQGLKIRYVSRPSLTRSRGSYEIIPEAISASKIIFFGESCR